MKTAKFITRFTDSTDPVDIHDYERRGGFSGLGKVLKMKPEEVIAVVKKSGLKGRGGAGFDTGVKWASIPKGEEPYIVCNADEGEPGTFKDRFILAHTPYLVVEGMTTAAYALGAKKGFIYIRGEYPDIIQLVNRALASAREHNYLGSHILGTDFSFDIDFKKGGGSYVVGDETALLNSLMGNRGYPWLKPPFPTEKGLWGKPTVINNVETLACVPLITPDSGEEFRSLGTVQCPGTKLFCVSGHVNKPGVYELPMGVTVSECIDKALGVRGYLKALQVGGTAGPIYDQKALEYPLDFVSMREKGGVLGSGALVVMNSTVNMAEVLEVTMRFFSEESCGQCFPCRYGTRQLEFMANRIAGGTGKKEYLSLIQETVRIMYATSFCPFGQSITQPVTTLFKNFGDELESFIKQQTYLKEVVSNAANYH